MKNLKNALLLKQLYQLKQLGYRYTSVIPFQDEEEELQLPNTMEQLKKQAEACHLCQLSKNRSHVVFGTGNLHADLMFVGESPGTSEDSSGKPFMGKSGELLTKMIENVLLLPRSEVYLSNIAMCHPPENRELSETEAHSCMPYLLKQITMVKPKIVVTLGASAYHYLSGDQSDLSEVRGSVIEKEGYLLVPTYHPSYLLRNPSAKKEVFEDLKKIKELL